LVLLDQAMIKILSFLLLLNIGCHTSKKTTATQPKPEVVIVPATDTAQVISDALRTRVKAFTNLNRSHRVMDSTMKRIIPSQNASDYIKNPNIEIVK
jgi:hypothetical protein